LKERADICLALNNEKKNDIKNIISEIINRIKPIFNPFTTFIECSPCMDDSRLTSRHHCEAEKIREVIAKTAMDGVL